MDIGLLERKFEAIGARLKVAPAGGGRSTTPLALDVRHDYRGEYFQIGLDERLVVDVDAVDVRTRERHLLLLAWTRTEKPRFLCGHDERHWFVAAVPENAHASNVRTAMEALKPDAVLNAQVREAVRFTDRNRRRNRAFVRQGEWFFLPHPELVVPGALLRHNEPLQRSGGKAHWAEFGFRQGGETVYVRRDFPQGLTEPAYREHLARHPKDAAGFRVMSRNAALYVRGRIRHPDHATIVLREWHLVVMNTENRAKARANVVFLD